MDRSGLEERQQVRVDHVVVRPHAVIEPRVDLKLGVLDQLVRQHRAGADRYDLVVVAVQISVGTSIFLRSSVKSVSEKALMPS